MTDNNITNERIIGQATGLYMLMAQVKDANSIAANMREIFCNTYDIYLNGNDDKTLDAINEVFAAAGKSIVNDTFAKIGEEKTNNITITPEEIFCSMKKGYANVPYESQEITGKIFPALKTKSYDALNPEEKDALLIVSKQADDIPKSGIAKALINTLNQSKNNNKESALVCGMTIGTQGKSKTLRTPTKTARTKH